MKATKNIQSEKKNLVACNFVQVLAQYEDVETLKAVANDIASQLKDAFEARYMEIAKPRKTTEVTVEAQPVEKPAKKEAKPKAEGKAAKKPAKKERKRAADDVQIDISDKKAIKALGLKWEQYNERSWVLRGNTKPIRDVMMGEYKGRFNSHLNGGAGMIFSNKYAEAAASALGMKVKLAV